MDWIGERGILQKISKVAVMDNKISPANMMVRVEMMMLIIVDVDDDITSDNLSQRVAACNNCLQILALFHKTCSVN